MSLDVEQEIARLEAERDHYLTEANGVLARLNDAKEKERAAARQGSRGNWLAPAAYNTLTESVSRLAAQHQRCLQNVARIKRDLKVVRIKQSEEEHRAYLNNMKATDARVESFAEHFVETCREMLDSDVFATCMREATLRKTRALVRYQGNQSAGSALGVRAAVGGMRQRQGE